MSDKKDLFEELLNEVQEVKTCSEELTEHLSCAGTCETTEDFFANVKDALIVATEIVKGLKAIAKKK